MNDDNELQHFLSNLTLKDVISDPIHGSQNLFDYYVENAKQKLNNKYADLISKHSMLTVKLIKENPDISWNMNYISLNTAITFTDIFENNLNWNYDLLSRRPDLTSILIESNLHLPWDFWYISTTPLLTYKMIINVPHLKKFAFIEHLDPDNLCMKNKLKREIFREHEAQNMKYVKYN